MSGIMMFGVFISLIGVFFSVALMTLATLNDVTLDGMVGVIGLLKGYGVMDFFTISIALIVLGIVLFGIGTYIKLDVYKRQAQNAAAALMQEGADFDRVMSDAGIPVEELRLGRGETDKAYEDAVFALESGEVSGQLTDGTDLCFVKCVNAYDEAATRERKEQIFEERRRKAFEQILEQFGQGKKAAYPEGFFGEVSFDEAPVALVADFFAIDEKYAGQ